MELKPLAASGVESGIRMEEEVSLSWSDLNGSSLLSEVYFPLLQIHLNQS